MRVMRKRGVGGLLAGAVVGLLGAVACGPTGRHTDGGQRPAGPQATLPRRPASPPASAPPAARFLISSSP
ncbi:MAG TPA: hypothetical protein VGW38_24930, partial [Chloroflexota bacterium]|nr:hypothetical protein [Chloroflexota bacterium]